MQEDRCTPPGVDLINTHFGYTLSLISGKYKMLILYWLSAYPGTRFNELKRSVGKVAHKTLSSALKELERDNLVVRKEYPEIPPRVEYSLTERGKTLIPVLDAMCVWGREHQKCCTEAEEE